MPNSLLYGRPLRAEIVQLENFYINFNLTKGNRRLTLKSLKKTLPVLMLSAPVFIFTSGSFVRTPTWFIDLTVATCHVQYTFLSLYQFVSRGNGQNTKILEVRHFRMIRKWPPTVTGRAKDWYWENFLKYHKPLGHTVDSSEWGFLI